MKLKLKKNFAVKILLSKAKHNWLKRGFVLFILSLTSIKSQQRPVSSIGRA